MVFAALIILRAPWSSKSQSPRVLGPGSSTTQPKWRWWIRRLP